jgi:UDP-galactopyranose mutase
VLVVDRRPHVGGNAYDERDEHGVLVHRYGPHLFHTNADRVVAYLSRFTEWRPYEHRVLADVGGVRYPFPINRTTLENVYGRTLDETEAAGLIAAEREPRARIATSEDHVLDAVGRRLYDMFFRGYTLKQWGVSADRLSAGVAARIPVRTSRDDRYFTDRFQAMPLDGYTALFNRMLAAPGITLRTGTSYADVRDRVRAGHTIYTGPIDEFFDYRFGKLPYRSIRFEFEHHAHGPVQPVGTINFPGDEPFTRSTEFGHITGSFESGTTIVREFPRATGDPYYPIPAPENEALYRRYLALARKRDDVSFVGRLAQYRYFNMDQVVAAALLVAERLALRAA